ncbi:MAG: type III pantothenate kinase [Bacteroidota bacterium]
MKLIVDIGNTLSKLAIFDKDIIVSFNTIKNVTVEDLVKVTNDFPKISSSILSSVALHDYKLNDYLLKRGFFIELDHTTPVPFNNKYGTPSTLGKDRIAIATAATTLYPNENILIIDTGTSVTFDIVTINKEYLGGSISPGLSMRLQALHNFTHKLPLIKLPKSATKIALIGDSTEASILSGVINGLTAEIESIINQYSTMFSPLKIVISGGDYKYFEKLVKSNIFAAPNIVVTGLKCILDFNEKN